MQIHLIMGWIPLYKVALKNLDSEAPMLRDIFDKLQNTIQYDTTGYRFDAEAKYAAGWWFFTIHVKEDFIKRLVTHIHEQDPDVKDEGIILEIVRRQLKSKNSTAVIKYQGDGSIFAKYWSWLMR